MKEFLFNPMVEEKKKRDLMKSLADDAGLSKHTLNFMNLLLDQGRLFSIAEIFDQFEIQYCKLTDTQVRPGGLFLHLAVFQSLSPGIG